MTKKTTPIATKNPLAPSQSPNPPSLRPSSTPEKPGKLKPRLASEPSVKPAGYRYQAPPPYVVQPARTNIIATRQKNQGIDKKDKKDNLQGSPIENQESASNQPENEKQQSAPLSQSQKVFKTPDHSRRLKEVKSTNSSQKETPTTFPFPIGIPFWNRHRMSAPPRMLILSGPGQDAFVAMPNNLEASPTYL
nr:hypothetical protein L203_04788 [Cryptococcus depauperatus CBS 7841]